MGVRGTWWKEPRGAAPPFVPVTGLVSCRFGGRGVSDSTDDDDAGLSIFPPVASARTARLNLGESPAKFADGRV